MDDCLLNDDVILQTNNTLYNLKKNNLQENSMVIIVAVNVSPQYAANRLPYPKQRHKQTISF